MKLQILSLPIIMEVEKRAVFDALTIIGDIPFSDSMILGGWVNFASKLVRFRLRGYEATEYPQVESKEWDFH